jgi:hypothetical protein
LCLIYLRMSKFPALRNRKCHKNLTLTKAITFSVREELFVLLSSPISFSVYISRQPILQ